MSARCALILASVLILMAFFFGNKAIAQDSGAIRGTVVDEAGLPVSGALVNASALNGRPQASLVRFVETDRDGRFAIDRLEWGVYGVFAMKEEAGYPDLGASLYSHDVFPRAAISPSSPVAEVRIQLGPKAGIVKGAVSSIVNGAPVNAGFKLTRAASPQDWLSTSAPPNYRILLPSSTDVLLEVTAPGFKAWNPGRPLRLEPGAELRLDISLEPSHDPDLHSSKFLVPEGYLGWLMLEYNVTGAARAPSDAGVKIFRFPESGLLETSSSGPERGAEDQFFYYSPGGSLREVSTDYRNGKGMVWGKVEGTRNGVFSQFAFFVGNEEQYRKFQTRATRPGPISAPQR